MNVVKMYDIAVYLQTKCRDVVENINIKYVKYSGFRGIYTIEFFNNRFMKDNNTYEELHPFDESLIVKSLRYHLSKKRIKIDIVEFKYSKVKKVSNIIFLKIEE